MSDDGRQWHPARNGFLVPFAALAKLVCGKLRAALSKRPDLIFPEAVRSLRWVVHCTAWGEGDEAVLRYLARSVLRSRHHQQPDSRPSHEKVALRSAISIALEPMAHHPTLSGHEFMRRFLQHATYALAQDPLLRPLAPDPAGSRARASAVAQPPGQLRIWTHHRPTRSPMPSIRFTTTPYATEPPICPHCMEGHLIHIGRLHPKQASGP